MNIFKQIKNSVYGPEYYKKIVSHTKLSSSIKYFAKLSLLIATFAVVVAIISWPVISKMAQKGLNEIVSLYPSDLEVDIIKGEASINQPEPYFIKNKEGNQNLLVINTKEDFSISKFRSYGVDFMLSKTELIGIKNKSTGQLQIMPLPKDDIKINQVTVIEKQAWLVQKLPLIFIFTLVIGFIVIFSSIFLGTLVLNFIYAFGIWVFAKIFKWSLSYKKSYQLCLHAVTLVTILGLMKFFGIFGFLDSFSMKFLFVLLVIYINFSENFHNKNKSKPIRELEAKETN